MERLTCRTREVRSLGSIRLQRRWGHGYHLANILYCIIRVRPFSDSVRVKQNATCTCRQTGLVYRLARVIVICVPVTAMFSCCTAGTKHAMRPVIDDSAPPYRSAPSRTRAFEKQVNQVVS